MKPPPDPSPSGPVSTAREWSEVVLALGLISGLVVLLTLDVIEPRPVEMEPAETVLYRIVEYLELLAEIAAALVIAWGVIQAFGSYLIRVVRPGGEAVNATEGLRLRLGRTLALGIEFTLAADILATAVAPTRADILTLAALVLLRTLLNTFLEREIREGRKHRKEEIQETAG
ncbi:DUF1622 domain-containing protein [Rubrivirga sp.]|uniref:DUF1622 domain-containing protein n=1 Tax=Rubrivirga sp. TaxID=1885344 RepID=UPI003C766F56